MRIRKIRACSTTPKELSVWRDLLGWLSVACLFRLQVSKLMAGTPLRRRDTLELVVHSSPVRILSVMPAKVSDEVKIRPCESWRHNALMDSSEHGQRLAGGRVHEVAHPGAGQRVVAEIVIAGDESIPQPSLGAGGDGFDGWPSVSSIPGPERRETVSGHRSLHRFLATSRRADGDAPHSRARGHRSVRRVVRCTEHRCFRAGPSAGFPERAGE